MSDVSFIVANTEHGMMLVNKNDYNEYSDGSKYGVGYFLLRDGSYAKDEVSLIKQLLELHKQYFGTGVVAIDGGANIGVHTLEYAKCMKDWGSVISFEAQETVYYALCGNIVMNNLTNVKCKLNALGDVCGTIDIPVVDYSKNSSFGSIEIIDRKNHEFVGQSLDYTKGNTIPLVTIDSLNLDRLDFVKLDIEGMEVQVLNGMKNTLKRHKPMLMIEVIKSDNVAILEFIDSYGYDCVVIGGNIFCIHRMDPTYKHLIGA